LLVGLGNRDRAAAAREGLDGPQALADGADIKVNLDLVILYITITLPFGIFIGILILINLLLI
jgi:hypothetical protein